MGTSFIGLALLIAAVPVYADDGNKGLGFFFILLFALVGAYVYFFPSIKADQLKHPDKVSIFVLNLLLGWLLIPWVIALVWAYKKQATVAIDSGEAHSVDKPYMPGDKWIPLKDRMQPGAAGLTKKCPFCAEDVKVEAIICKHCKSDLSAV